MVSTKERGISGDVTVTKAAIPNHIVLIHKLKAREKCPNVSINVSYLSANDMAHLHVAIIDDGCEMIGWKVIGFDKDSIGCSRRCRFRMAPKDHIFNLYSAWWIRVVLEKKIRRCERLTCKLASGLTHSNANNMPLSYSHASCDVFIW